MYICLNCRTPIKVENTNINVTCPKCSGRVLFKETPEIKKNVVCR